VRERLERSIYRGAVLCGVLMIGAVTLPRFVPHGQGGFAAAANAAIVFLALAALGAIAGLLLLARTVRHFDRLGPTARVVGLMPAVVTIGGLVWLLGWLRF